MSYHCLCEEILEFKQSETEIRHAFKHLVTTLCNQKWKIVEQMSEWSKTLIRQIQEHVSNQRKLLEQIYENKVSYLDSVRDRFLQQALVYEQDRDLERVHQLINQCTALKSNVAVLVYTERSITSIQLLTEEQLSQPESAGDTTRTAVEEECPTEGTTQGIDSDAFLPSKSGCQSNVRASRQSLATTFHDSEEPSVANSVSLRSSTPTHDMIMEKCPLCYMIFSNSTSVAERNRHINEHYRDD